MRELISLGQRCDVAFQLRMHSGNQTAHFFDWLSTPAEGLIAVVERDFDVFHPEEIALTTLHPVHRVQSVECLRTGIQFPHHFPSRKGRVTGDFMLHYGAFHATNRRRAERLRQTVRSRPTTLVRRTITQDQAERLEAAFDRLAPGADLRFLYVNHDDRPFETRCGRTVAMAPPATGFGSMKSWADLLMREGLIETPYRLTTAQVIRHQGEDYNLSSDNRHAEAEIAAAADSRPDSAEWMSELARHYESRRDYGQAEAILRRAIELSPADATLPMDAIRLRWLSGAITACEFLERTGGQDWPGSDKPKARASQALGRHEDAVRFYARAICANPADHDALSMKAKCLMALGRPQEALLAAALALGEHPDNVRYLHGKASCLSALGRRDEAIALAERAVPLGLGFDGRWFLADELIGAQRRPEALALLRGMRQDFPQHEDRISAKILELDGTAAPAETA